MTPRPSQNRRRLAAALAASPLATLPAVGRAQEWPAKPIRILSPSAPGGSTDTVARLLADRFAKALKVAVVVENRPGGTGSVALDALARSAPDGHTLAVGFAGANVIYPLLNPKLPFDAQKAFAPVTLLATTGNILVVHPSVPARTLPEFLAWAKAQPKPPGYGSWGNGSGGHLAGEYLKLLTGVDLMHVPYRSASALTTDMVGGHMPVGFLDLANAMPQIRAGKLVGLAQTGPARATALTEVPTMVEQGVAFGVGIWFGLFAPAGTPRAIVDRLHAETRDALLAPELAERWLGAFGTKPSATGPDEFAKTIRSDWDTWKSVIERGKITLE